MESAILYIRRDDCIVGYPCVLNQIEESRIYAERNGIEIKKAFIDTVAVQFIEDNLDYLVSFGNKNGHARRLI